MIRNHQSRPTRFEPFFKVNAISSQNLGCGWGRGHSHGHGRNPQHYGSYGSNSSNSQKKKKPHYTTKSGVILRQNKKMDVVCKNTLDVYLSYTKTFGRPLPNINKNKRKKDKDKLYRWWWIGLNLLWHWFLWKS